MAAPGTSIPNPVLRSDNAPAAQHLATEIEESGQRIVAAIAASEKRVRAAIAEVLGQFEAHGAETDERISRGEARQRWRDRIVLLLCLLAAEILGPLVPLC